MEVCDNCKRERTAADGGTAQWRVSQSDGTANDLEIIFPENPDQTRSEHLFCSWGCEAEYALAMAQEVEEAVERRCGS